MWPRLSETCKLHKTSPPLKVPLPPSALPFDRLMKKAVLLILSVACLAAFQSSAFALTFGDLGPYWSFHHGDGGGIPEDVPITVGQQSFPGGAKLFGSLGPL